MTVIALSVEHRQAIADAKAACPFLGTAVETGALAVHNTPERPLAAIEDIVALGDSGGGDLGRKVLALFAVGNHSRLPGPDGRFEAPTPEGLMSLDLAGSQGAHPGHSGILLGDPAQIDTGRFDAGQYQRLADCADDAGRLTTDAVGDFIAENLMLDVGAKVLPIGRIAGDLFGLADEVIDSLVARLRRRHSERDEVELREKLTKLAGEDNLVGAAGEFGLLFAFLARRPEPDGQEKIGIRLSDVEQMFVHHRFPDGWADWPKFASDWVHSTTALTAAATKAYLKRKF